MLKPFRHLLIMLLLGTSSTAINADLNKISANFYTQLYAKTCVANAADLSVLKEQLKQGDVPELSASKAVFFLENQPGTVWVIPNVIGDFLVSINDQEDCSVYTRHVNINTIEQAFMQFIESMASSFTVEKEQDETLQTELGPMHFISYTLTNKDDNSKQKFKLMTSTADRAEIQAKATVEALIR